MKFKAKSIYILFLLLIGLTLFSCKVRQKIKHYPDFTGYTEIEPKAIKHNDSLFTYEDNYLIKNKYNQWELYVKGDALERGLISGTLLDSLNLLQERIFVNKIDELVPSERRQKILLSFLSWYNRKMYKYIPNEYLVELYGMAKYMSPDFNFIGPAYLRNLYYHGAHDIGHAMTNFSLVECTSASVWDGRSEDGKMVIGRNLDFYLNDDFAKNKLLLFVEPTEGIPYVSIAWPGMIGVVSGMNYEGLTITMNAGKSSYPLMAKQPISILARDILEHSSTIEEAVAIASKSKVFVSEALMIGSAKEKRTVIIEITPKKIGVYEVNDEEIICSNHFQSETYKNNRGNKKRIANSHSQYRYERMDELLEEAGTINPEKMAEILRNRDGLGGKKLGMGNEKAINQLISHHGVIFKPEEKMIWVSSSPYNLGAFVAYNLNEIFGKKNKDNFTSRSIDSLVIPADEFLNSEEYADFKIYREVNKEIIQLIKSENYSQISDEAIENYRELNPDFWEVHYRAGLIYYHQKRYTLAKEALNKALAREITTVEDEEAVQKLLKKTEKKLKKK